MLIFALHYNLLLSQWNLTLFIFVKVLILTNKAVPKSFEDVDNDLSLYKLMKSNLLAGKPLLFLNLYFFALHFSFPSPKCCTPQAFVHSVTIKANG